MKVHDKIKNKDTIKKEEIEKKRAKEKDLPDL